ncbi:MAG: hypothetical protein H0X25_11615 [Acidobacteriales bacterium]|nr:hypothetical protein [Terriglobales bacterium]
MMCWPRRRFRLFWRHNEFASGGKRVRGDALRPAAGIAMLFREIFSSIDIASPDLLALVAQHSAAVVAGLTGKAETKKRKR